MRRCFQSLDSRNWEERRQNRATGRERPIYLYTQSCCVSASRLPAQKSFLMSCGAASTERCACAAPWSSGRNRSMLNRACPRPTSRHGATKACAACPAGRPKVWGSSADQSSGVQGSKEHGGWGRHQGQEGIGQPGAHKKPPWDSLPGCKVIMNSG